MNLSNPGKILIISGIVFVIAGVVMIFAGDKLKWIGNLPGDIRIVRENFRFYFPLTTMIIISVLFSLFLWLVRKIL